MINQNILLSRLWQSKPGYISRALLLFVALSACDQGSESEQPAGIGPSATIAGDYLSGDLRQKVQKLRSDVEQTPSNVQNIGDRVDVLWQWANAMGRRDKGMKFAPNLTLAVTQIKRFQSGYNLLTNPDGSKSQSIVDAALVNVQMVQYVLALFDGYVKELGIREDDPEALGRSPQIYKDLFQREVFRPSHRPGPSAAAV